MAKAQQNRGSGRGFAVSVAAMRWLALVVALHCTGFVHAVDDFTGALAGVTHVDEDCGSADDPEHDCPPGCPSCHGASGFLRALPCAARAAGIEAQLAPALDPKPPLAALGAPRATHRSSVYRPPRPATFC